MKTIKIKELSEMPENYTGITEFLSGDKAWFKEDNLHREDGPAVEYSNGTKEWCKDGKQHREDGPAIEWADGDKEWHLEGIYYPKIDLKNFVILDYDKGKYGIMWYRLLDKDKISEYPDIPGLITK